MNFTLLVPKLTRKYLMGLFLEWWDKCLIPLSNTSDIQKVSRVYLEFSVNYQSLQYPQRILTTQPTDIGTPALLTVTTSALLSARGSIQQKNDDDYTEKALPRILRNIELDVRYGIGKINSQNN